MSILCHSRRASLAVASCCAATLACSSSPGPGGQGGSAGGEGGAAGGSPVGGPVPGEVDTHCAAPQPIIIVNPASCNAPPPDGGVAEEPAVLFNSSGADDDCKYNLAFTTTPIRLNQNATFKVTATALADGAPVTGADIGIEGELGTLHVLPNNGTTTSEPPGSGVYTIGPVKFDASGRWTIRFHLFERCNDLPDSPHGHASFFLDVP
jgi:hypothetical protein